MKAQKNRIIKAWVGSIIFLVCVALSVLFLFFGYEAFEDYAITSLPAGLIGIFFMGMGIKQKTVFPFSDMREKEIITIIGLTEELNINTISYVIVQINGQRLMMLLRSTNFLEKISPKKDERYIKVNGLLVKVSE